MNLVEDILDLAKIEAGNLDLNFNPFVIASLINEIKFVFENQCNKKHLYFNIDCENNILAARFNSDMNRIRQILINVISNSFKFTNQGGITLSVRLINKLIRGADTKCIEFVVSDTGTGISDEDKRGIVY